MTLLHPLFKDLLFRPTGGLITLNDFYNGRKKMFDGHCKYTT
jgi:hypothetical protein